VTFGASLTNAKEKTSLNITFPDAGCSHDQVATRAGFICRLQGEPDGIPTYSLYYKKARYPIMVFSRSVEIVISATPDTFAVNSYEGSNFTDCYVFWNGRQGKTKQSLSGSWRSVLLSNKPALAGIDHAYYTCSRWVGKYVVVTGRWVKSDGSYVEGSGKLYRKGGLREVTYRTIRR